MSLKNNIFTIIFSPPTTSSSKTILISRPIFYLLIMVLFIILCVFFASIFIGINGGIAVLELRQTKNEFKEKIILIDSLNKQLEEESKKLENLISKEKEISYLIGQSRISKKKKKLRKSRTLRLYQRKLSRIKRKKTDDFSKLSERAELLSKTIDTTGQK